MHDNSAQVAPSRLERLVDEQVIRNVLVRYCQGVDRKDWEQVLSCYHEDAVDSHGGYEGAPSGLVTWMQTTHRYVDFSMHVLTNTTIDFLDDGRARAESYVLCYKTLSSAEGDAFLTDVPIGEPVRRTVASRFIDVLEDRGTGWRIARRDVVLEFVRREANDLYLEFAPGAEISRRDETDLLYRPVD
jgi:3-phenylpropionate/cinnamic acid dioxygenase small subunit